jgi:UDP-N-acetylglucosamine 2-epimerase (non-hydrolysing)
MPAKPPFRVVSIVGTRPEAIKMAPVVRAIAASPGLSQRVVLTGQHQGLADFFAGAAEPSVRELRFDPRGRPPHRLREAIHAAVYRYFLKRRADLVLVHGDTTSAFAGALAAFDLGIPIGHVEAGLRSFDFKQPWPEEGNRVAIDVLADLLFAPTQAAARNLATEWRVRGRVHVTGNTGIDELFHTREQLRRIAAGGGACDGRKLILATCHRKENQGEPARAVCSALRRLVRELPVEVVLPLHPNPHVRRSIESLLADEPLVRLVEPLDYEQMVALMDRCWLILTDSGGLQEEGAALGRPVLVLRNVTERPEALVTGNIELVGTDEARVVATVSSLFHDSGRYARMARPSLAFGDGRAAPRIVKAIETCLRGARRSSRPLEPVDEPAAGREHVRLPIEQEIAG